MAGTNSWLIIPPVVEAMPSSVISLTSKLLAFRTVNPPGDERKCAQYLGALLQDAGFRTREYEFADKRTTLIATLPGSGDKLPICFVGHLDTVPLGITPWTRDPFAGESDGEKLFGRGASDMKSGVAAITMMALRLAQMPRRKAEIKLILTAGEETCCQGAAHVAGVGDAIGQAGAIVVGEPTANVPWIGHKGCIRYSLTTKGVAAHASMPEEGINAIYKAAEAIQKLQGFDLAAPRHPLLGSPTLTVSMIAGGAAINIVPDEATLCIDIRTLPAQEENQIYKQLAGLLGREVTIQKLSAARGISTDPEHPWVQQVYDILEKVSGQRAEPAGAPYFTDASVLTPACSNPPTVILGPGEPQLAHKTDEYCYLWKVELALEAYTEIARRWCEA